MEDLAKYTIERLNLTNILEDIAGLYRCSKEDITVEYVDKVSIDIKVKDKTIAMVPYIYTIDQSEFDEKLYSVMNTVMMALVAYRLLNEYRTE